MSLTINDLVKQAVSFALTKNWEEAIKTNLLILEEKIPELGEEQDSSKYVTTIKVETNLRLGFAYLQLGEFKKAKKHYKEVLSFDPINKIALDKMKLVKEEKTEAFIVPDMDILLKEPGTSIEVPLEILTKGVTAEKFIFGEELLYRVNNKIISIHKDNQTQSLINYLTEAVAKNFLRALKEKAEIQIKFVGGKDKKIRVIITSSVSVFPSEKQDIRPYVKSSDDGDTLIEEDGEIVTEKEVKDEDGERIKKDTSGSEDDNDHND